MLPGLKLMSVFNAFFLYLHTNFSYIPAGQNLISGHLALLQMEDILEDKGFGKSCGVGFGLSCLGHSQLEIYQELGNSLLSLEKTSGVETYLWTLPQLKVSFGLC